MDGIRGIWSRALPGVVGFVDFRTNTLGRVRFSSDGMAWRATTLSLTIQTVVRQLNTALPL